MTGMDGSPFDPAAAHLVASNGRIHDAMLDVIRTFRAERARSGRIDLAERSPVHEFGHSRRINVELFARMSGIAGARAEFMHNRLIPVLLLACTALACPQPPPHSRRSTSPSVYLRLAARMPASTATCSSPTALPRSSTSGNSRARQSASSGWFPSANSSKAARASLLAPDGADASTRDFTDDYGNEIEQELRLRLVPISFTVRALPLGQSNAVSAVHRRRLGVINWRYSEFGEFVDFGDQQRDLPRLVRRQRQRDRPGRPRRDPLRRRDG